MILSKTKNLYTVTFLGVFGLISLFVIATNQSSLIDYDFKYFDTENYLRIAKGDYLGYLTAFFPLFPLLWKTLGSTWIVASLLNICTYLFAYSFLSKQFNFSISQHLIYLTIPSSIFYYIPYSEAFFFLFSALILASLQKKQSIILYIALFFASLTRPIVYVFIPALILLYLNNRRDSFFTTRVLLFSLLSVILGLLCVFCIQFYYSNEWFSFFNVQREGWGNEIQLPKLPFTTWSGNFILVIDGIALWSSAIFGFAYLKSVKNSSFISNTNIPLTAQFALSVIAGTGLLIVLTRGGSLFSLNRFIFATPFFIIGLHFLLKLNYSRKLLLSLGISFVVFSILLGSYQHIKVFIKYLCIGTILTTFLFSLSVKKRNIRRASYSMLLLLLILLQTYFVYRVITNQWIG